MTRSKFVHLCLALVVGGCAAGSEHGLNAQVGAGNIDLDVVDEAQGLYRVIMFNVRDFDWNTDRPEDQQKVVAYFLGARCSRTETLSQSVIQVGNYGLAGPRLKRILTVKCYPKN